MQYKDTLELYDELLASGTPEPQARAKARQLGVIGNVLNLLRSDIAEFKTSITKDLFWMRVIGAAMIVTFFSNGFFVWIAK